MPAHPQPPVSPRKQPRQARSTELVAAVMEGAVRVLEEEGARGFTAARVAERAGVSVGSLYQYFPNKAAILFRLQSDEWKRTAGLWRSILGDVRMSPPRRLRALAHAFVRSECEEVAIRRALADAAPFYRDAPEAREAHADSMSALHAFMAEAMPKGSKTKRLLAVELVATTLGAAGKHISEISRTRKQVEARTNALADMLCAYLAKLRRDRPTSRGSE